MNQNPLDTFLTIRVSKKFRTSIHKKAKRYGNPSDVIREILEAFVEDRLLLTQSESKENLYVNRHIAE